MSLKWQKAWKLEKPILATGGDPITTKPTILVVDEEVRKILEEAGFLTFFNKFKGNSEGVTRQFIDSWKEGRVSVDKSEFLVSASLIKEASSLPNEGEVISREKLNQGMMKMLVDFISSKSSPVVGPSKGGFTRVSRTPITKAQLLLGLIPCASILNSSGSTLEEDEDSDFQEKNSSKKTPTGGKPSLLDVVESSKEERVVEDPSPTGGKSNPTKGPTANPSKNVESPGGPFMITKELKCHLRVLNSLGSSLSSTFACVNLLTIEVTNYLKEALKIMKDKNLGKE
eukprot:Gb_28535 [translate_table: standard]